MACKLFDLTGKTAVVVGGAGGLGQAIAQGLAEAGAKVLISSRKEDSLKKAQEEIKAATGLGRVLFHGRRHERSAGRRPRGGR